MGGLVNHVLKLIHVECLPDDIPQSIDVDVTNVELGQVLHVSDLSFSDKIKVLHRPNEALVSVYLEKIKEEETPADEEELAEGETAATSDDPAAEEGSDKKEDPTKKYV